MAITSTGLNAALATDTQKANSVADKTSLEKDDFLKLLLVELQHQDPTEPMDSEKILSQTSQLATLESAQNTNDALKNLATSLGESQQFSTISAIGRMADLGSDTIAHKENETSSFDVYFPSDVKDGTVSIKDSDGNVIRTLDLEESSKGVQQFTWNGRDSNGDNSPDGIYHIEANYTDTDDKAQTTKFGAYPIESVRFEGGETLVKVGSKYVPMSSIKEVY